MDARAYISEADIKSLVQRQKPAHSLEQAFYIDPDIYNLDLEKIFFTDWLYVCHSSQIAQTGDCFTYDIANESIIVTRDEQMQINAFANVCRHRGSRICSSGKSNQTRLVCPYHAWTYSLSGELLSARQMPADFDKSISGLKELLVEVFCGFVFVSFSKNPPSFTELNQKLSQPLQVFDLEHTKVVHYESHPIQANWKLVFENFFECYHCGPAHKEFAASHSLALEDGRRSEHQRRLEQRASKAGIITKPEYLPQSDPHSKVQAPYFYDRYALYDGYLTGSGDGKPVAPLLGDVKEYDGGAGNLMFSNLTYLLVYADHVVLYRFTPHSVNSTDADLVWLVRSDAQSEDIDIERMRWLWNVTTVADKEIIERNQKGVLSRFYQPGPYAPMEIYTIDFIKWYLDIIT